MADALDADLVTAARHGDQAAWSALVHKHSNRLWAIARSRGLDRDSATDVVQTAWLNLLQSLDRLRDPAAVGAWLAQVVRHEADRVDQRRRRVELVDPDTSLPADLPEPSERLLRRERQAELRRAFATLNARCQQLLQLMFAEAKLSYQEIADALGRPIGSLGATRARCLDELRRSLATKDASGRPLGTLHGGGSSDV